MAKYEPALPNYEPDDGRNEKLFGRVARECADIFNGLPGPSMLLLLFHLVRHSMGQPECNYLVEMMRVHGVPEIPELDAKVIGEAYTVLLKGQLLENSGELVVVPIFGEPDHEEDMFTLGSTAAALLDFKI